MTQKDFTDIYNISSRGIEMIDEVLGTIAWIPDDREYLRKMMMHIVRNERIDAAIEYGNKMKYN